MIWLDDLTLCVSVVLQEHREKFRRKHQRIATGRGKTLSKKPVRERKRAQKVCSLLY